MTTFSVVPLRPLPAQSLLVTLNQSRCRLDVYVKRRYPLGEAPSPALYVDVYANDVLVLGGVLARNGAPLLRDAYLAIDGELFFVDTQGDADPEVAGLGSRWVLGYVL